MLTADLVGASVWKGVVRPRYVDPASPELLGRAEELSAIFRAQVGRCLGELDLAVGDAIGDSTDYLLVRGLVKLLMDGSRIEMVSPRPPPELRACVFRLARARWPVTSPLGREQVLLEAARELGVAPDEIERSFYSDLEDELRLVEAPEVSARGLLERYNLALAQGVLLRAREVVVELPEIAPKRARQVLRSAKFHRLLHRAEQRGSGYRLTFDGPLSLLRRTQRYGVQLALFLPTLCRLERWRLVAAVAWGRSECRFELDDQQGLSASGPDRGVWDSEEERHFEQSFRRSAKGWTLRRSARLLDLDGRGVLVPDYELIHKDGRRALLDIVWGWRRETFLGQLALVREVGPRELIVAVASRLNQDAEAPALGAANLVLFKGTIPPARIIAVAEQVARRPSQPERADPALEGAP
jgi:predicted nuclease of restriction endonuclease-like RecB superfamily